jgi:hypothetical protein
VTIRIPTRDLVGILSDAIPFAATDKDDVVRRSVRIAWDGETLSAQATDGRHFAWSTWHPDDEIPEEAAGDLVDSPGLVDNFGGDDTDAWSCVIALDDAKTLVKDYRLPPKQGLTPLSVEGRPHALTVRRDKDTGLSAKTTRIEALALDQQAGFPDMAKLLRQRAVSAPVTHRIAFSAERLAHFGKVRAVDSMELELTEEVELTECAAMAVVRIGERFVGGIVPVKAPSIEAPASHGSDVLRYGSGVHVGGADSQTLEEAKEA